MRITLMNALVISLILALVGTLGYFFLLQKLTLFGKPSVVVDLSRPAVVKQMQQLGRLETSVFTIEKIIDAGTQGNVFQEVLYGDRILLIAHGQVVAGVDLSGLSENDVSIQGRDLTLKLPAPTIFSSALNSQETRVYDRRLGLLSKGDKDLETQAREQAELSIRQAACDSGILKQAQTQAETQVTQLFKTVGFENVTVQVPAGSC